MRTLNRLLYCLVLPVAIGVHGCSAGDHPELGTVHGTVTLDGRPLAGACVVFQPSPKGRASSGLTDKTGRYELIYLREIKGAKVGPHRVRITTASEEHPDERLPARYHHETILTAEVQSGENPPRNFHLTSDPEPEP